MAFFNHLLRAVTARGALLEYWHALFFTKTYISTYRLGRCRVLNALNLEKMRGKNPQLCPFTGLSYHYLVIPHACPYFLE